MTREEAAKKVRDAAAVWGSGAMLVDSLVALGLLKLDEPKSVSDRFIDALEAHVEHKHIGDLLHALDCANLKIVEK